jgi:polygalacturonase
MSYNPNKGLSLNVKDFGATGDGVTDDTAEVQAAITAAEAKGLNLFFPDGDYKINVLANNGNPGSIGVTNYGLLVTSSAITLYGVRGRSKLLATTGTGTILACTANQASIESLVFDTQDTSNNQTTAGTNAIRAVADNITIRDCVFEKMANNIISGGGFYNLKILDCVINQFVSVSIRPSQRVLIQGCKFQGGSELVGQILDNNAHCIYMGDQTGGRIDNCTFTDITHSAIVLYSDGTNTPVTISNCHFWNFGVGIAVQNANYGLIQITGNQFHAQSDHNHANTCILLDNANTPGINIVGNAFYDVDGNDAYGISIKRCAGALITGNLFSNCFYGIFFSNFATSFIKHVYITKNLFFDCSSNMRIYINDTGTTRSYEDITVEENKFYNWGTYSITEYPSDNAEVDTNKYNTLVTSGVTYSNVFIENPATNHGAFPHFQVAQVNLATGTGATATAAGFIPSGALLLGVSSYITTGLNTASGVTGFTIGDGSDVDRWGTVSTTTAGTKTNATSWTDGNIQVFPTGSDIVLTAAGGTFNSTGGVRLVIHYYTITDMTS